MEAVRSEMFATVESPPLSPKKRAAMVAAAFARDRLGTLLVVNDGNDDSFAALP